MRQDVILKYCSICEPANLMLKCRTFCPTTGFHRTFANFGQPLSDVRLLFADLCVCTLKKSDLARVLIFGADQTKSCSVDKIPLWDVKNAELVHVHCTSYNDNMSECSLLSKSASWITKLMMCKTSTNISQYLHSTEPV